MVLEVQVPKMGRQNFVPAGDPRGECHPLSSLASRRCLHSMAPGVILHVHCQLPSIFQ